MFEISGKVLREPPLDLSDTRVHGECFDNLPSRKKAYNASRAFRTRGGTISIIGAPRTMTTADEMKGLERFVSTTETLVQDLERQNSMLADNLRESRETESKLRVFVLQKCA